MATPRLILKKFSVANMKTDTFVVLLSRKDAGKSSCIKDIAINLRHRIHRWVCFGGSLGACKKFREYIPELYIFERWDGAMMQRIMDRQSELKQAKDNNPSARQDIAMGVLIDDVSFNKSMLNGELIRNIAMNGRHIEMFVVFALHYVVDMPPPLRAQIDYVFILQEPNKNNRDKIYKNLGGPCESALMFNEIMMTATNNFGCLVMDFKSRSNNMSDCMYWYRARIDHPPMILGSREYQRFSELHMQAASRAADGRDDDEAAAGAASGIQLDGEGVDFNAGPEGMVAGDGGF